MSDIDSAIDGVTQIGGSCNAGAGLSACQSFDLFFGNARGTKRILIVIMAGKSVEDVSAPANFLKSAGVKIIGVGIRTSVDESQLSAIAFPSSYFLTIYSYSGLSGSPGGVSILTSKGIKFVQPSQYARYAL